MYPLAKANGNVLAARTVPRPNPNRKTASATAME
jgi:hypothetical protein